MIQKNRLRNGAFFAAALLASTWINSASAAIVTSMRPLGFIVAAVADGVMPTEVLLPDGASPHDYALRPSDVQKLRDADLVVWIGPEMEAFLTKSLAQRPAQRQIILAQLPTVIPLLQHGGDDDDDHDHSSEKNTDNTKNQPDEAGEEHHHGEYNMHLWLSPAIAKQAAVAIHAKLLELMPQQKAKLDANLQQFEQQLAQREQNIAKILGSVHGKGYFVFHDAYGYFEQRFGLTPLGHFTINPEIQPGAQHLNQIKTQLAQHQAVCIFSEPQFRPAVITAVAQGTGVRIGSLDPLGSGIALSKESYVNFLSRLAEQYVSCLK